MLKELLAAVCFILLIGLVSRLIAIEFHRRMHFIHKIYDEAKETAKYFTEVMMETKHYINTGNSDGLDRLLILKGIYNSHFYSITDHELQGSMDNYRRVLRELHSVLSGEASLDEKKEKVSALDFSTPLLELTNAFTAYKYSANQDTVRFRGALLGMVFSITLVLSLILFL